MLLVEEDLAKPRKGVGPIFVDGLAEDEERGTPLSSHPDAASSSGVSSSHNSRSANGSLRGRLMDAHPFEAQ
jgi:hypothetical protein